MAAKNPYQTYQNNSINTASPGELTLMLYNGCLKFITLAKAAMEQQKITEKNENIQKAQAIVKELMVTLKPDADISTHMLAIYDFVHRRLMDANIKNDPAILDEAAELIREFRDTWKQVIQENRIQQFGTEGGQA